MKKPFTLFLFIAATSYFLSCVHDPVITLDRELLELLDNHSQTGSFTYFRMPESTDYASLPFQDAKNPVTEAKVELGKLLFFETGIGLAPKYPTSSATYSCATCHIPMRGLHRGFNPSGFSHLHESAPENLSFDNPINLHGSLDF